MAHLLADPLWRSPILWSFFLIGIATGTYAFASLIRLFSRLDDDRRIARAGIYYALPLTVLAVLILTTFPRQPEGLPRALVATGSSQLATAPWFFWTFVACAFLSGVCDLLERGLRGTGRRTRLVQLLNAVWVGRGVTLIGALTAFLLSAETTVLINPSNSPPVWPDPTWIAPLFLATSATTGLAALLLAATLSRTGVTDSSLARFVRALNWTNGLEAVLLAAFAVFLGDLSRDVFGSWPGLLIPVWVAPVGLFVPMALKRFPSVWTTRIAAILILLSGVALRAALLGMPLPPIESAM